MLPRHGYISHEEDGEEDGDGHCPEGLRSLSEVVMVLSASIMWWCGVLVGGIIIAKRGLW